MRRCWKWLKDKWFCLKNSGSISCYGRFSRVDFFGCFGVYDVFLVFFGSL